MNEKRIHFDFEARYYVLGEPGPSTTSLWFILHGHGHLAKYFLSKFKSLDDGKTVVVAPEGLNRYYLEGFTGRVGSTWMTREDRLTDIGNYISFLNAVYKEVMSTDGLKPKHTTLLGFSQGAATVSRWAVQGGINFDRLILWAGIFPPDMDYGESNKILSTKELISVFGDQDEFVTDERWQEFISIEKSLGVETRKVKFRGGHTIDEETLKLINND